MQQVTFHWQRILSYSCLLIGLVGWTLQVFGPASAPQSVQPESPAFVQSSRPAAPDRLVISSAKIDFSLTPASLINGNWQISQTNPNYLTDSARPGENGNVVVYGHNTQQIFGHLKATQIGDKLTIETANQVITYEVVGKYVVWPSETNFIQSTGHEVLTIYTCTGLFDSQRLVLQAKPISAYYRTKLACAK